MKKIFSLFFLLACSGLFISVACNNNSYFAPTKPDNPSLGTSPTPTPTNLNGYTSTPTPTWTPTFTPTLTPIPTPMNTVTVPLCAVNVPNGLAIGNSSIYVAGGDGNLSIFSTAGASVTVFNNIGTTIIFGNLYGVAVDTTIGNSNSGCYYVLDYGNNTVYEFTSSNAPVTSWNNYNGVNFNQPEGIGAQDKRISDRTAIVARGRSGARSRAMPKTAWATTATATSLRPCRSPSPAGPLSAPSP